MSINPSPPLNTFVVRFWWSPNTNNDDESQNRIWNAHIEHVQSGDSLGVRDIDMLLNFIERFTGPLETDALQIDSNHINPASG
jgi:hypothetical protein